MFVKPMGEKRPPNVKVGLTADEARVHLDDLRLVLRVADGYPHAGIYSPEYRAALDRLELLQHALEAVLEPGRARVTAITIGRPDPTTEGADQ